MHVISLMTMIFGRGSLSSSLCVDPTWGLDVSVIYGQIVLLADLE